MQNQKNPDECIYCGEVGGYPCCDACGDKYEKDFNKRNHRVFAGMKDCTGRKIYTGDYVREINTGREWLITPMAEQAFDPKVAYVCMNLKVIGSVHNETNSGKSASL